MSFCPPASLLTPWGPASLGELTCLVGGLSAGIGVAQALDEGPMRAAQSACRTPINAPTPTQPRMLRPVPGVPRVSRNGAGHA